MHSERVRRSTTALWHALPPFRFPRVPERLLPIACLCIAALFAYAVAQSKRTIVSVLAVALLFVDLHAHVYGKSAPGDPAGAVPSAAGRLLELPVFDPGVHYGSVYLWYDTAALRQRPGGYSTTAPKPAKAVADRLERLNCGDWSGDMAGELKRLGVGAIALHRGLYVRNPAVPSTGWFAARGLLAHGWRVQRTAGPVWLFERGGIGIAPKRFEPARSRPIFCQGWFADTGSGRYMSETHAPFWVYGRAPAPARVRSFLAHAASDGRRTHRARAALEGLAPRHDRCGPAGEGRGREPESRLEAVAGGYIPIAWYPESTYSVVPVTFLASSERR